MSQVRKIVQTRLAEQIFLLMVDGFLEMVPRIGDRNSVQTIVQYFKDT